MRWAESAALPLPRGRRAPGRVEAPTQCNPRTPGWRRAGRRSESWSRPCDRPKMDPLRRPYDRRQPGGVRTCTLTHAASDARASVTEFE